MWQTEASIEVAPTPEQAFAYLSDLRRHAEWSTGVASIKQVKGQDISVGAEFKAEECVPVTFTSFSRITLLEAPRRIAWTSWDGRAFEVDWSFDIQPQMGGAKITQRAVFRPRNLFGRFILAAVRRRRIPSENRASLERLKTWLQSDVGVKPLAF